MSHGNCLKIGLIKRGETQASLADAVNAKPQQVNRWANSEHFTKPVMEKVLHFLGMVESEFIALGE